MASMAYRWVASIVSQGDPLDADGFESSKDAALSRFGSVKRGEAHRRVYTMARAVLTYAGQASFGPCTCPLVAFAASKGKTVAPVALHLACAGHGPMIPFGRVSKDAALACEGCTCEGHDADMALLAFAALDAAHDAALTLDTKWNEMTPPEQAKRTLRETLGKQRPAPRPVAGLAALALAILDNGERDDAEVRRLARRAAPLALVALSAPSLAPHTCGPRMAPFAIVALDDGTLLAHGPKGETWGSYGQRSKGCRGCRDGREVVAPSGPVALSPIWGGMHADTPAAKGRNKALGGHTMGASRMDRYSPLAS